MFLIRLRVKCMSDINYKKKVSNEGEKSSPKYRAERLRRLRNLANLSRKDLCDKCKININTYKGWELARFGGLPLDGAEKITSTIHANGVIATTAWLLHGTSPEPTLINKSFNKEVFDQENTIQKEFYIFNKNHNENTILFKIKDELNSPTYNTGDYVAGIKHYGEQINETLNKVCVIQTSEGFETICLIKKSKLLGLFTLISTNILATSSLIMTDVKLNFSAPITRHYINIQDESLHH